MYRSGPPSELAADDQNACRRIAVIMSLDIDLGVSGAIFFVIKLLTRKIAEQKS